MQTPKMTLTTVSWAAALLEHPLRSPSEPVWRPRERHHPRPMGPNHRVLVETLERLLSVMEPELDG